MAARWRVLNASRHHRKNRLDNQRICGDSRIVLNASRHHRKNRLATLSRLARDRHGAQRLAASQEKSQIVERCISDSRCTCSTPRGITGKIACSISTARYGSLKCSTPRGITGKIARPACTACGISSSCSTPRGITGKIASKPSRSAARRLGAQRLAASQEKSLRCAELRCAAIRSVLNASRHHRKNRRK